MVPSTELYDGSKSNGWLFCTAQLIGEYVTWVDFKEGMRKEDEEGLFNSHCKNLYTVRKNDIMNELIRKKISLARVPT